MNGVPVDQAVQELLNTSEIVIRSIEGFDGDNSEEIERLVKTLTTLELSSVCLLKSEIPLFKQHPEDFRRMLLIANCMNGPAEGSLKNSMGKWKSAMLPGKDSGSYQSAKARLAGYIHDLNFWFLEPLMYMRLKDQSYEDASRNALKPEYSTLITHMVTRMLCETLNPRQIYTYASRWQRHVGELSDTLEPYRSQDSTTKRENCDWYPLTDTHYINSIRFTPLTTYHALLREGVEMNHCLSYLFHHTECVYGSAHIYSITDQHGERYTVQIDQIKRTFAVNQLKGRNDDPAVSDQVIKAVATFVDRLNIGDIVFPIQGACEKHRGVRQKDVFAQLRVPRTWQSLDDLYVTMQETKVLPSGWLKFKDVSEFAEGVDLEKRFKNEKEMHQNKWSKLGWGVGG